MCRAGNWILVGIPLAPAIACPVSQNPSKVDVSIPSFLGGEARILSSQAVAEVALHAAGPNEPSLQGRICAHVPGQVAVGGSLQGNGQSAVHSNFQRLRVVPLAFPPACHTLHSC